MKKGVMMQGFEWYLPSSPHLWKILRVNAYKLKKAGITAIWLPPAYKGAYGVNDTGYSVYDHYDLGEFNSKNTIRTKYGTKKEPDAYNPAKRVRKARDNLKSPEQFVQSQRIRNRNADVRRR